MTASPATGRGHRPARSISAAALVGRDAELATLVEAVARPPSVAVVEGEAGIGKTRLVSELLARPDVAGRRPLVGACRQVRDPFPLGPVVEAVRQLAGALAGVELSPLAGALRPLLPELAGVLPPAPEPVADLRAQRHRAFRALVEVLAAVGPAVLVLEDLHWADDQTPDFLRYLLADPPPQLSTVLTYRPDEVAPAVRALTARLPRTVHHTRVALSPLDVPTTGALAAAILDAGTVSQEFASYLCERASGLPFAIEELLALLQERGSVARRGGTWARRALDRLDVPASIRDQVLERVSHLGPDARAVLDAAAVLQVEVSHAVLAAACPVPAGRLLAGLDDAVRAGILVSDGERVRYRHVLAAQAVYEDLSPPQRQRWHELAAAALRTLDPPPLGRIASHLRHADRTGEWVEVAEQAADQAAGLGHYAEAARLLEEVLRHAPLADDAAGRIAVKLARVAEGAADSDGVVALLSQVLDQRRLDHATRGELSLRTAVAMDTSRHDVRAQRRLLRESVDQLPPDRADLRAWAMACLGIPLGADEPLADLRGWLTRALAEAPRVADPAMRIRLLGKVAMVLVHVGDRRWRDLTDQIAAVAPGGTVQLREEAWAYYALSVECAYAGHHDTADQLLGLASGRTPRWDNPARHASLRSARALIDYCRGDWDGLRQRADRLVDELVDFAPARAEAELVAACLRLAGGDLDGARERLGSLYGGSAEASPSGMLLGAWLRLALADGDVDGALAAVRRLLTAVEARGIWAPLNRSLPAVTAVLSAAGDRDTARDLVERADRELARLDAPLATAALRHSRGMLAAAAGDRGVAGGLFLAAADGYRRRRCPYEAAQALEQAAACLLEAGDPAGEQPWRAALEAYQRLGATWDLNRTARLGRRHGISPPTRHRRGRRGYGSRLSPREREVAERMAAGRTNQEIAADLFLSVSTVEKHAMAVLRKLGARSRQQVGDLLSAEAAGPADESDSRAGP